MNFTQFKIVDRKNYHLTKEDFEVYYYLLGVLKNIQNLTVAAETGGHLEKIHERIKDSIRAFRQKINCEIIRDYSFSTKRHGKSFTTNATVGDRLSHEKRKSILINTRNNLSSQIREYRLTLKVYTPDRRRRVEYKSNLFKIETFGGVHNKPDTWSDVMHYSQIQSIFSDKNPKSDNKHLGIELEFFCDVSDQDLAKLLFKAGLRHYVTLKSDGSIRPERSKYAHELCILVEEEEHRAIVEKVCEVLKSVNARVNKTCGMHVHIDMRSRDRNLVFHNLVSSQSILYAMNPKSRQQAVNGTRYCARTRTKIFTTNIDRYHGINPQAYNRHGTIEVRIHSGTVDAIKINNWLDILLCIVNRRTKVTTTRRSVARFGIDFNVPLQLQHYITERINKFKVPNVEAEAA